MSTRSHISTPSTVSGISPALPNIPTSFSPPLVYKRNPKGTIISTLILLSTPFLYIIVGVLEMWFEAHDTLNRSDRSLRAIIKDDPLASLTIFTGLLVFAMCAGCIYKVACKRDLLYSSSESKKHLRPLESSLLIMIITKMALYAVIVQGNGIKEHARKIWMILMDLIIIGFFVLTLWAWKKGEKAAGILKKFLLPYDVS
jgi:hypothetical protein